MYDALLSTKIYIPPVRENAVARPILVEKLMAIMDRPGSFALISSPAGFGKTTLLGEFVTQLQHPTAWVSMDEGDDDPVRFWSYLIAACQMVHKEIGASAQSILQSPQPLPAETIPIILINDLVSVKRGMVLVLDDFHVIRDKTIHEAIIFLLDHLPANLHILLSTRGDPPWPMARFRVRNQLIEIRAQDLRFTTEEAATFLNRIMELNLTTEDIAALEERTEGWVAGLQLAALSMQGRRDISSFVKSFTGSHVYVAEYLIEEVFQRQPENMQAFLLQTSILERLTAELCEAVTGRQDGREMLRALHQANLFITPLDDKGQWFRYHHLFADLLQVRLQHAHSADEIADLHRAAAGWYEEQELIVEAVNHSLAAKDFKRAARLIGENAAQMVTRGELTTLMRWTETMPEEVIWLQPSIVMAKIWALTLSGAVREVEPLLQQAEAQYEMSSQTPASRELAGFAAAVRAFFAMMAGEDDHALDLAERAELLLPESSVHARWLLPYTIGTAYRSQGQYDKAAEEFARQARMGEEFDNLIVWGTGVTAVALVRRAQGRLRETSTICHQALNKLADRGADQFGSLAKLETPLVEVLREQNELEEAQRRLTDVIRRMRSWPMPTDRLHTQLAQIEIQEALGDLQGAFETLRSAKELKNTQIVLMNLRRSVDLCEIRLTLKSGEITAAESLIEAYQPGTSRWVELRDHELLLLARLRLAQGRLKEAEEIMSQLASDTKTGERKSTCIKTLVLQACILHAQGRMEAALGVLLEALALAEPEGFVRVFVDEGEVIRQLLIAVTRQLVMAPDHAALPSKAYIARLLDAFPEVLTPDVLAVSTNQAAADLVEQLTPRELEVLQLIAAGDSNRRIAEKLVITVSAVKKHATNIYGKLNVDRRTQAVARARQLGLLPIDE
jgi:LuxR family maltose regulon positive regulatory protein